MNDRRPLYTTILQTAKYDETAVTPLGAVIVKPLRWLTVYGSYAQGLSTGPTAPNSAANAGAIFAPTVSEQIETGIKADFGNIGATLALFQITQPSGFTNPTTNVFALNGEQRNRGIELNMFGTPAEGVKVLGGITLLDGVLTKTPGGTFDGFKAPGVSDVQISIGGEVDVPFVQGLTATGRIIYSSAQYYDQANTQKIPDWTRLDLGARYLFKVEGRQVTARFNVENVAGVDYWAAASQRSLSLGTPRTFKFSLSADL